MKTIIVAVLLAILTLLFPQWIEHVFGVDPDHGSGTVEVLIVLALVGVAVGRGVLLVVWRARLRAGRRRA